MQDYKETQHTNTPSATVKRKTCQLVLVLVRIAVAAVQLECDHATHTTNVVLDAWRPCTTGDTHETIRGQLVELHEHERLNMVFGIARMRASRRMRQLFISPIGEVIIGNNAEFLRARGIAHRVVRDSLQYIIVGGILGYEREADRESVERVNTHCSLARHVNVGIHHALVCVHAAQFLYVHRQTTSYWFPSIDLLTRDECDLLR